MPHTEQDSLDLMLSQSGETMRMMLQQATMLGELRASIDRLEEKLEESCSLGHETRNLLEKHLLESKAWELVITKSEAFVARLEFWKNLRVMVSGWIAKGFAVVAALLGLVITAHSAWPHIKDFFRGH